MSDRENQKKAVYSSNMDLVAEKPQQLHKVDRVWEVLGHLDKQRFQSREGKAGGQSARPLPNLSDTSVVEASSPRHPKPLGPLDHSLGAEDFQDDGFSSTPKRSCNGALSAPNGSSNSAEEGSWASYCTVV